MANPFSLEGKTILVTGASSGIGRSIAVECSKMGATIVLNGRNLERLNETVSLMEGEGHIIIPADIASQEDMDRLIAECPVLTGVVNCAGISTLCALKNISRKNLSEIIETNEVGPILLSAGLLKKKKIQKKSSIVFIASVSGVTVGHAGVSPYSASKGALSGFMKSASYELASQGIRVNTICPGVVPTSIIGQSEGMYNSDELIEKMAEDYPLKRVGKPEDMAYAAIFLLSDASEWVTGVNLPVDGGYSVK